MLVLVVLVSLSLSGLWSSSSSWSWSLWPFGAADLPDRRPCAGICTSGASAGLRNVELGIGAAEVAHRAVVDEVERAVGTEEHGDRPVDAAQLQRRRPDRSRPRSAASRRDRDAGRPARQLNAKRESSQLGSGSSWLAEVDQLDVVTGARACRSPARSRSRPRARPARRPSSRCRPTKRVGHEVEADAATSAGSSASGATGGCGGNASTGSTGLADDERPRLSSAGPPIGIEHRLRRVEEAEAVRPAVVVRACRRGSAARAAGGPARCSSAARRARPHRSR